MHAPYPSRSSRSSRSSNLPRPRRALWSAKLAGCAAVFLALTLMSSACSDDDAAREDDAQCSVDTPCPDTQSCLEGVCIAREMRQCTTRTDCPGGDYQCIDNVCTLPTPDAGADAAGTPQPELDATGDPDVPQAEGPQIVETNPVDGAEDVALDTPVTITFNEAMDPTSMNFYSLVFRDANNLAIDLDVEGAIEYDPDTFTTTLTSSAPLKPAEGYRVEVRSSVRNLRGALLDPPATIAFSTRYEEPAKHTELARTWAPVLYQGIDLAEGVEPNEDGSNISNPERPDADIPTRIDFDGNQSASDNLSNSKRASTPIHASIYYSVSESDAYYFLHYILYYPSRYAAGERAEHDFAALVVVVDKASEGMLFSETISLSAGREFTRGFKPEGSPARVPGGSIGERSMRSFDPNNLEDGTRFPLYVLAGVHEACHWYKPGRDDGHCLHSSAQFPGPATGAAPDAAGPTSGVLLRAGDDAQSFEQAALNPESGFWEMSYALTPIPTGLWALRGNYDQDGLFDLAFAYKPEGDDRPTGVEEGGNLMLPKNLRSDAPDSNGRTPFSWLATPTKRNRGQWLLDPAFIMESRYLFGGTASSEYCYNFYLNIDNRDSDAHPACQD